MKRFSFKHIPNISSNLTNLNNSKIHSIISLIFSNVDIIEISLKIYIHVLVNSKTNIEDIPNRLCCPNSNRTRDFCYACFMLFFSPPPLAIIHYTIYLQSAKKMLVHLKLRIFFCALKQGQWQYINQNQDKITSTTYNVLKIIIYNPPFFRTTISFNIAIAIVFALKTFGYRDGAIKIRTKELILKMRL